MRIVHGHKEILYNSRTNKTVIYHLLSHPQSIASITFPLYIRNVNTTNQTLPRKHPHDLSPPKSNKHKPKHSTLPFYPLYTFTLPNTSPYPNASSNPIG